jgi:polyisoprenoid-binding protein YceI
MSTTTEIRRSLPSGTWQLDPVHSSIGFEIEYLGGVFRGQFRDVEATLAVHGEEERHQELRFVSDDVSGAQDDLTVRGEITIKGVTKPVELTGTTKVPLTDGYGRERLGLTLSTTLDRKTFGVDWNMPLPSGEPALSDEVTLVAELYFVREA